MIKINIIYFHTHDLGRFCEPYGYKIPTPNIQGFAEEGVLFRNAFCLAPTCSPSRAALLTGQYPHQNGIFGLTGQGWRLNDYNRHLAGFLSDNGYTTALCGTHHVDSFPPENVPYDHFLNCEGEEDYDRWETTNAAIDFIKKDHQQPFFLAVGYDHNHHHRWETTYQGTKDLFGDIDGRYSKPLPPIPDTSEIREETALFHRAIKYVDLQFGRILEAVEKADLTEDTLIIFTTDHGTGLPHIKMNLTDWGTGVSLILRGPAGFSKGKVIDSMVTHIDIYPTICELIKAEEPDWLEGQSIMPLINGEKEKLHEEIYLEQTYHGRYAPLRAVRTERFKYVRRCGKKQSKAYYNADKSIAYDFLLEQGFDEMDFPEEQLFDLYFDTNEVCNVIDDERYQEVADQLRAKLDSWLEETNDPILAGKIELPEDTGRE